MVLRSIITFTFLLSLSVSASLLHDALREGNIKLAADLLESGTDHACYRPDAVDKQTGQTTLDALAECKDNDVRRQGRELLDKFCKLYNVTIRNSEDSVYPMAIADRRFPRLGSGSGKFFADHEILDLYAPTGKPLRIGKSGFGIPVEGYWVVQQLDGHGCGHAALKMRELDIHGFTTTAMLSSGVHSTQLQQLFSCANIASIGVTAHNGMIDDEIPLLHYLYDNIPKFGPALVNGFNMNGGGHWAIVDEIVFINKSDGYAVVRDPYHGWRIKIILSALAHFLGIDDQGKTSVIDDEGVSLVEIIFTRKRD